MRVPPRYIGPRPAAQGYAAAIGETRPRGGRGRLAGASGDAVRYLLAVAATIVIVAGGFVGVLWGLELAHRKPPPAFTNSYCFDAKLEFLRENPPVKPTHLIVGSSISWRNFDGDVVVEEHPDARPLNASFCGLSVNQSAYAARFFLQRYPTITDVLLMLDPFDMSTCRSNKTAIFDAADVSAYLSGADDLNFYFKYFDFFSLLVNAFSTRKVFNRHGDGPLYTNESYGLVYGPAPGVQAECEAALARLAQDVEKSGRRLVVMTMPLLGEWSDKYDANSQARVGLAKGIRRALEGRSAAFWDAWSEIVIPAADYTDAVHLRWSGVPRFTRRLVRATGFGGQGM